MTTLQALGLTRHYGSHTALDDVDLDARPGTITCILGPTGSGKSTLLRHLHLLERPDHGYVLLNGARVPPAGPAHTAALHRYGLVQQRPGLLRATAHANVAFAPRARGVKPAQANETATTWLQRVGLTQRAHAFAARLSGGEAQRVALARALCTRPDVLLVDEGTNQLDPRTVRSMEALLLEERNRGCTLVMATHNVAQARRLADAFVFLDQGRVVEAGDAGRLASPSSPQLREFLELGG